MILQRQSLELRRAMEQLKFPGVMVFSNINGIALSDQSFWPLWEAANELGAIVHIHPTNPVGVEAMLDYWLMPLVGFLMDTTLAAASLVFTGVAERFPNIKWVLGHLGGAIPYLAERLDRGYEAFADCRKNISRPPSAYLKKFYFDTVNFDPRALELAVSFAGASQILAGSDYPHQIGSIPKMLESLQAMRISEEDRQKILAGTPRGCWGFRNISTGVKAGIGRRIFTAETRREKREMGFAHTGAFTRNIIGKNLVLKKELPCANTERVHLFCVPDSENDAMNKKRTMRERIC